MLITTSFPVHLQVVELEKKEKQAVESQQDEESKTETPAEEKPKTDDDTEDSFVYKDQTFSVGDFVYIEPRWVRKFWVWKIRCSVWETLLILNLGESGNFEYERSDFGVGDFVYIEPWWLRNFECERSDVQSGRFCLYWTSVSEEILSMKDQTFIVGDFCLYWTLVSQKLLSLKCNI